MKTILKYFYLFIVPVVLAGGVLTSCEDDDATSGGTPVIHYIRVTDPAASDSLLNSAYLGNMVAIMGANLQNARHLYFNDKEAVLTPTFITSTSIITRVPNAAPVEVTNKIRIVFTDGSELLYDFEVSIPAPEVIAMDLEYVPTNETAVIRGNYFFAVTPIEVLFTGENGDPVAGTVVASTETSIDVVVPPGAGSGPVTVKTNFGQATSSFHFRDQRNIVLNYDDAGMTPTGAWRNGIIQSDEHSLDGNYVFFQGVYNNGERTEGDGSPYESQFWAQASGRPEGNLLPGDPSDYVMKFEIKVIEWFGSDLNICFAPWNHTGNQEIWSNSINARAVWGPWRSTGGTFTTGDKWITVTIPMTEFKWAMGTTNNPASGVDEVTYTEMAFNKNVTGSLSFWVLSSPQANNSPFEFYIDNVRIVAK